MKINWIVTSVIAATVAGMITWFLTGNWKVALVSSVIVFVVVMTNNPKTRYMKAFYVVLFPLLCNIYFTIQSKTENFDIQAGLRELDIASTVGLFILGAICLFLDYLERNGKLNGTILSVKKNKVGDINGDGNTINQTNV